MKTTVFFVAILTLIAVGPAQAQDSGVFLFGVSGTVPNLGWVAKGTKITGAIATARLGAGGVGTCPIRTTILLNQINAGSKLQKVTKKQNAALSTTILPKAKFHGDALCVIQAQNASHRCISQSYIDVAASNADRDSDTQDLSMEGMPSDDRTVDVWTGDEVPDQSIPLQRNDLPQQLLDYLDNTPY